MKLANKYTDRLLGAIGSWLVRGYMRTLDYRIAYYDSSVDPALPEFSGPNIYCFWHENILFPLYLRGHNNLAMLLSRHRDAEVLSEIAHRLGFEFVRGSTFRGGSAALRELMEKSRHMNLTITPDGPRGPRRSLAQGPIYLSSKLQLPLVLMGFGYDRPWRMPTWDQFAVPRPFCRARAVISPPVQIPANLDRDGLEHYRRTMEQLLNRLTCEAETWAESGTHKRDELPLRRQSARKAIRRIDAPHTQPKPRARAFAHAPAAMQPQ